MKLVVLYIKAFCIMMWYHRKQFDKGGNRYYKHPLAVSKNVKGLKRKIVALLHDTVEDTSLTLSDLRRWGFTSEIIIAVDYLTRRKNETYMEFVKRAKKNKIARDVKIADINSNLDISRISNPTEKDYSRSKRYKKALAELAKDVD